MTMIFATRAALRRGALVAISAAALSAGAFAPSAVACDRSQCPQAVPVPELPAAAGAATPTATAATPVRLDRFRRRAPTRAAARAVKTDDSSVTTAAIQRRSRVRRADRRRPAPQPKAEIVEAVADGVPSATPLALAAAGTMTAAPALSAEALAASTIEVVSPDEVNRLDLAAGPAPVETTGRAPAAWPDQAEAAFAQASVPSMALADASASSRAVSLDELNRRLAPVEAAQAQDAPENKDASWVQRMLIVLGGAFASAAAAARLLMG